MKKICYDVFKKKGCSNMLMMVLGLVITGVIGCVIAAEVSVD
jgi:hypothetical protein